MDILRARYAFMSGLCCYFLGSFLAIKVNSGGFPVAVAAAILYGIGFGWTFVCMNTVTAHYYGPAAFPKVNGMVLLLTGVVGSPAGVIGGKLFDRFGSYAPAFELNVLVSAIGILALAFAHMPKHQVPPEAVPVEALSPGVSAPR
jgi:MFS family permease